MSVGMARSPIFFVVMRPRRSWRGLGLIGRYQVSTLPAAASEGSAMLGVSIGMS